MPPLVLAGQTSAALGPNQITMWWVALGTGVVVILVVATLLWLLLALLKDLHAGVEAVSDMATRVEANTAAADQLAATADALDQLDQELSHHRQLFGQDR